MTQQPNTPAPVEKAAPSALSKAAKVHAIVNTGPYPGMSEAFNDHMGAECWTDPSYAPDASMWAAAWKAALKAQQAAQPMPPELDVRRIMLGISPGDGNGCEEYAKTVADVEEVLTKQAERIEELEMKLAAQPVDACTRGWLAALSDAIHSKALDDHTVGKLREVLGHLAARPVAGEPVAQEPIGYMSPKQVPLVADPIGDAEGGKYIPMRKTPAGNFTLALYTAAPAPVGLVPLTLDQIGEMEWGAACIGLGWDVRVSAVQAVERAHGIKAGKDGAK